jgi:hypothetical protein
MSATGSPPKPADRQTAATRMACSPRTTRPSCRHARLQDVEREDAGPIVDELTHEQIRERIRVLFEPQLFEVEEIAAALFGVQDGDDLTPDPVKMWSWFFEPTGIFDCGQ